MSGMDRSSGQRLTDIPKRLFRSLGGTETFLLGGAANVVHNIQALGGNVSLCGVVGDDEMGRRIIRDLKKIGIGTQGLFMDPDRQTTVKTRIIAHHQQVVRIDRETSDAIRPSTLQALSEFLRRKLKGSTG
jgi:D-beta-D-heptose 7-phosphate kinase/D-beta-D-heptose 1-phosphate adenosyltransferase